MMKRSNIIALILFLVYLAAVAYCCFGHFSDLPQVESSYFGIPSDKIVHFLMFFPFPILFFLAFDRHTTKPWQAVLMTAITFALGCALAAATEIGQSFTTYRSGDPLDFYADILSLGISSLLILTVDIWKMKRDRAKGE